MHSLWVACVVFSELLKWAMKWKQLVTALPHISPLPFSFLIFYSSPLPFAIHSLVSSLAKKKKIRSKLTCRTFVWFFQKCEVFLFAFNGSLGKRARITIKRNVCCCPSRTGVTSWCTAVGRTCPSTNGAHIGHSLLSKETWLMTGPLCSFYTYYTPDLYSDYHAIFNIIFIF